MQDLKFKLFCSKCESDFIVLNPISQNHESKSSYYHTYIHCVCGECEHRFDIPIASYTPFSFLNEINKIIENKENVDFILNIERVED